MKEDILGRITSLTDHDGTGIVYTLDAEGKVTRDSHSDGSTTEYAYNAAGQLTQAKEVMANHSTRREITYAYDDQGNLLGESRRGVDIDKKDEFVRYTYDKDNMLVKTTIEGVATNYTTGYTWDDVLGLYFAQNRFYDSENHRFTQDDPVRDGANWYVYFGQSSQYIYADMFCSYLILLNVIMLCSRVYVAFGL